MSSSTKRNVVVAGLDDNESTDNKWKLRNKNGRSWKVNERREYEEDPELEEEDEDNEYKSFDYDDLHLAYPGEKSPKYVAFDHLRDALSVIFGLSELKGPMKDQPLSADASPTTLSLGYIADFDPEEDKEDPKEDPADHPADG
ncbi:hypothetical protein Tco_0567659 [Tanacetum coccineum]